MKPALLIGVDGGATEVKAHAVTCADWNAPDGFALRPEAASIVYPPQPGFEPRPVAEQLAQRDAGRIELGPGEAEAGRSWVRCAAAAIAHVARQAGERRILLGMGMPGLKTADGRGICVLNHGPRIPQFLTLLEQSLADAGLELAAPVAALGSDADYCGLGEQYATDGLFRDVASAYYLGGGTGIADALKLGGQLIPLDHTTTWLLKSWQMPSSRGPTFEQLVSVSAINRRWAQLCDRAASSTECAAAFPEEAALAGDARARDCLDEAANLLAELIFDRLWTVHNGRAGMPANLRSRISEPDHPYRGTILDRVVIGQRLGQIYGDTRYRPFFGDRLDAHLAEFIAGCGDPRLAAGYLSRNDAGAGGTELRPGLVVASRLRAAPAIGAAVAAVASGVSA